VLVGLTLAGPSAHAAFPGTNGKIACHGPEVRTATDPDDAEDYDIFSINEDGSAQTFLAPTPVRNPGDTEDFYIDDINATYSPDGKKIALESFRSGASEVYTMNADGSGLSPVSLPSSARTGQAAGRPTAARSTSTAPGRVTIRRSGA